jgi:hypothetical protein
MTQAGAAAETLCDTRLVPWRDVECQVALRRQRMHPGTQLVVGVMVGCVRSRTGSRAYAALTVRPKSGICWRNSPNGQLVRDRGVGGSNPLAPTKSSKIPKNLQSSVWQFTRFFMRKSGRENRVLRTSNGGLPTNCSTFQRRVTCSWFSPCTVGAKIGLKPLC